MSGGHWKYDYWAMPGEILEWRWNVHEMAEYLWDHGKKDAGDELERFFLDLQTFARLIDVRQKRLKEMMKTLDYWICSDCSEKDFDEEWRKLSGGIK